MPIPTVSTTPKRAYQPVFSMLCRTLRIGQHRREVPEPHEMVRRGERVRMEEGFDDSEHGRVDGERTDEHHERCHQGVRKRTIAPGPPLLTGERHRGPC